MEEEVKEKKKLSPKAKRIINIVINVAVVIVLAFALFLAICAISSKKKGYKQYTEIFGTSFIAVQTDSMSPTFDKGDLIKIKTISSDEARKLKIGDIITFQYKDVDGDGKDDLITHRISKYLSGSEGDCGVYQVVGDNPNQAGKTQDISADSIVGVYKSRTRGVGNLFLFMGSSTGFFVCVVLPTLLIVVYCAVNLFFVVRKEKKVQTAAAEQAQQEALDEERERIRQELLAEMQSNGAQAEPQAQAEPEPEPVTEPEPETEQQPAADEEVSSEEKAEENKADEEKEDK